jgi:hypothetical protein
MSTLISWKATLIIYPLAATAGFLMGLAMKQMLHDDQKWQVQVILMIAIYPDTICTTSPGGWRK